MKRIKYRYNKWLFKKYGMMENIPEIFLLCPLWSPSYFVHAQHEIIVEGFMDGLTSMKDRFSFDISKDLYTFGNEITAAVIDDPEDYPEELGLKE